MTDDRAPFTFIATYDVLPGNAAAIDELAAEYAAAVHAAEPRTHALGLYRDDGRDVFTHVQMLAGSDAMEQHLGQIQDYLASAARSVRIRTIDVYGDVGPRLRAALDQNADAGATVTVHDGRRAGFGRLP